MKKVLSFAVFCIVIFTYSLTFAEVGKYNSFPWNWNLPFEGKSYVTQGYNGECGGDNATHFGTLKYAIDLAGEDVECGTPVLAPASGYVMFADWDKNYAKGFGNQVIVEAGDTGQNNGNRYLYRVAHLSTINVEAGWWVEKGDVLGFVGSTGKSTGCHVHFNINRGSYAGYGLISGDSFPPSWDTGIDGYDGCCNCEVSSEF